MKYEYKPDAALEDADNRTPAMKAFDEWCMLNLSSKQTDELMDLIAVIFKTSVPRKA